jgi:TetR/AcrR family fatty acid metabolism transcriptional regulator
MRVANSPAPRRERKKQAIRSRIIEAAIGLFSARGVDAVTVEEIAETADVGKGTVYNYFQAKEDIIVAFVVDLEQKVQEQLAEFVSSKRRLDTILADFVLHQFRLKEAHYRFVRVFLAEMFLRTEDFLPYMIEIQKVIDPPLEKLFRDLIERGVIRSDFEIESLIFAFKSVHLGLTALWAVEGPPFRNAERTVHQTLKMFSQGIQKS